MAVAFQNLNTPALGNQTHSQHVQGDCLVLFGNLVFTGNYATGGDALDFGPLFSFTGRGSVLFVDIMPILGYDFEYDFLNKKVLVRQAAAATNPLAELSAAAYPAAILAAVGGSAAQSIRAMITGR